MIPDVRRAIAAFRSLRGDIGEVAASGSTVRPAGARGIGADRSDLPSSRWIEAGRGGRREPDSFRSVLPPVVHEFTAAWERGEAPVIDDYLRRLDPDDVHGAVDLIYRAFCLAEADGRAPESDAYLARFPRHAEDLRGLFRIHACPPSLLARLMGPPPGSGAGPCLPGDPGAGLPEAGDTIGPYVLRRELGRGSFARVFLAEQADLASRLVVVKIATRVTREPWLLARARHAHIVEILSHAEVDDGDFQLICMPFWGGATLADVLAAAPPRASSARPGRRRGPTRGVDLLAALDAVGAPEYPSVHPARPAREILTPLSYERAIAWVIARLAEALDHAHGRGVTHGDIKPSNILLSADGNPMLLDFNLARDDAPALDPSGRPIDPGGTLAYMAPERLRALASAGARPDPDDGRDPDGQAGEVDWEATAPPSGPRAGSVRPAGGGPCSFGAVSAWPAAIEDKLPGPAKDGGARPADRAAHVSDIYSLGMVLLESLSGRAPSVSDGREAGRASRPARLISAARAYATARERPAREMIRDFETASGRPISPALGAILGRCLDPDPARRYRRALELAEDLDRWRTDRPLAYADEPFWGQAVPRWLRVRRRALIVAAVSILAVGLSTAAIGQLFANRMLRQEREAMARGKLAQKWDDPESGAFLRSQRQAAPHAWAAEDPEALDVARRALLDYGVIGPGGVPDSGDWRLRDDVRYLSAADRDDLEIWLMERVYRYCLALADRPDTPADWRRAMEILDGVGERRPLRAFGPLRDRLAERLREPAARRAEADAPAWLDEHLLGFAAERVSASAAAVVGAGGESADRRAAIERALKHYDNALAGRPGSFWVHYRAASAYFGLDRRSEAAYHLGRSLERRPDNAVVRAQLARCLVEVGRYSEALEQCDRAVERAPHFAEVYRTRAYTRTLSRLTGGLEDDLHHFEMFSRVLPPSRWGGAEARDPLRESGLSESAFPRLSESAFPGLADTAGVPAWRRGRDEVVEANPDDIEARGAVAQVLSQAKLDPLARAEFEKILVIQPDHIPARIRQIQQAILDRRFDVARTDLATLMDAPGMEAYVRGHENALDPLLAFTRHYLKAGRPEDACWLVDRVRELAVSCQRDVGQSHYHTALVYAVLGASEPDYIERAASQLFRAGVANPKFLQWYRSPNAWFDPVRGRIDAALGRMEDPEVVHRRIRARSAATRQTGGAGHVAGR